jgi:hypothetical protein
MTEFISPITGEKMIVADSDFEYKMNWRDAVEACDYLKNGWRLPFKSELLIIYKELHKNNKGKFKPEGYWSKSENSINKYWVVLFESGISQIHNGENKYLVRAIKAIV